MIAPQDCVENAMPICPPLAPQVTGEEGAEGHEPSAPDKELQEHHYA